MWGERAFIVVDWMYPNLFIHVLYRKSHKRGCMRADAGYCTFLPWDSTYFLQIVVPCIGIWTQQSSWLPAELMWEWHIWCSQPMAMRGYDSAPPQNKRPTGLLRSDSLPINLMSISSQVSIISATKRARLWRSGLRERHTKNEAVSSARSRFRTWVRTTSLQIMSAQPFF
jgi:hypothetical protein